MNWLREAHRLYRTYLLVGAQAGIVFFLVFLPLAA